MPDHWNKKFWMPVHPLDARPIMTLAQARAFTLGLPRALGEKPEWQRATEAIIAAAKGQESVDAAREKLIFALYQNAMLDMSKTEPD